MICFKQYKIIENYFTAERVQSQSHIKRMLMFWNKNITDILVCHVNVTLFLAHLSTKCSA